MNTLINIQVNRGLENHHIKYPSPPAQLTGVEAAHVAGGEQGVGWLVAALVSPRSTLA